MPHIPRTLGIAGLLVLVLLGVVVLRGCSYGEISPEAYEFAKALYSICNRQDATRLQAFEDRIAAAAESSQLTQNEHAWLQQIVATARSGDWENAMLETRRLMADQVRGGP